MHAFDFSVIALAVYHASFVAEALRSGINTVPQGQAEAARAMLTALGIETVLQPPKSARK